MGNAINSVSQIVRALVSLVLLGILGTGGWVAYRAYDERLELDRELRRMTTELAEKSAQVEKLARENEKLMLALRLLKIDHRVAEITVLEQRKEGERPTTRFKFVELSKDGSLVDQAKEFTVEGDTVYVDTWVAKYADELVEKGDPLRSTSVCLFRRIFGEFQQPSEGFAIDPTGSRPAVYSQGDEISPLERDVWANFWQYANDPQKAKKAGLRAVHGEAPSIQLQAGKRYRIELRASAGLSIVPEDAPAKPAT